MGDKPSEIDEEETYWVVPDATGELEHYCDRHGVKPPDQVDETDLPESDNETINELDRKALSDNELRGKWNIFVDKSEVDDIWECVCKGVESGELLSAKASTKWSREGEYSDEHVVVVYTPNYFDKSDVFRVREFLKRECGIEKTIYYKPDLYTKLGIYSETAEEMGLPGASRYSG